MLTGTRESGSGPRLRARDTMRSRNRRLRGKGKTSITWCKVFDLSSISRFLVNLNYCSVKLPATVKEKTLGLNNQSTKFRKWPRTLACG